ncbi:MAG TPA: helix-turn-helix domain-containing protein [Actinomycetaceae bacterium]|nr:helix-turn-helix domain-containing protein [Actinomycetaceae bacterium]
MARLPDPLSRRDRQRQTREALIFAARAAFARDGYSGANLERIAREAGFSKGAVYSNFDGKADLFLAVTDLNIEAALSQGRWDVFEQPRASDVSREENEQLREAMTGFALATLEFIAYAARDERLRAEMGKRMDALTAVYTEIARESRAAEDPISAEDLGALLAALDQGAGLILLAGGVELDPRVLRAGLQRLLDPADTRGGSRSGAAADAPPLGGLHDSEVRQRIAEALREEQ